MRSSRAVRGLHPPKRCPLGPVQVVWSNPDRNKTEAETVALGEAVVAVFLIGRGKFPGGTHEESKTDRRS